MNHPITSGVRDVASFVLTGGIEGVVALGGAAGRWIGGSAARGGARSLGAAARGSTKPLQTGGNTLKSSTLKALGLTKEQGRDAINALKKANNLRPNDHFRIMRNGDIINPNNNKFIDNLHDYIF